MYVNKKSIENAFHKTNVSPILFFIYMFRHNLKQHDTGPGSLYGLLVLEISFKNVSLSQGISLMM